MSWSVLLFGRHLRGLSWDAPGRAPHRARATFQDLLYFGIAVRYFGLL